MKNLKELGLTENEQEFVETVIDGLYAEAGFTDVSLMDVKREMGVSLVSARGTLGALCKKGVLMTEEFEVCGERYTLIKLDYSHYCLHPSEDWQEDCDCGCVS